MTFPAYGFNNRPQEKETPEELMQRASALISKAIAKGLKPESFSSFLFNLPGSWSVSEDGKIQV